MGDLVNSIGEVGLLQPIVVTPENIIVSGHRRFKSIQSLGWDEVECEVKDIPDDEIDVLKPLLLIIIYNINYLYSKRNKNKRSIITGF